MDLSAILMAPMEQATNKRIADTKKTYLKMHPFLKKSIDDPSALKEQFDTYMRIANNYTGQASRDAIDKAMAARNALSDLYNVEYGKD